MPDPTPQTNPLEADLALDFASSLLGKLFALPADRFRRPSRGRAGEAFARMLLIYVAVVGMGVGEDALSTALARDRKTIKHALVVIEDLREARAFDELMEWLCSTAGIYWRFSRAMLRASLSDQLSPAPKGALQSKTS